MASDGLKAIRGIVLNYARDLWSLPPKTSQVTVWNSQLQQIGKKASRLDQERHGTKPIQREQFVGGTTRLVNVYGFGELDLLDQAISFVMDK